MRKSILFVRALVFAAYALAMLVPGWTTPGEQTPVEHARMMAVAGHEMNLADMGSPETDQAMPLCQQHCMVVVATLPVAEQAVEIDRHAAVVATEEIAMVSSLAVPPPGPPPKEAVI